MSIYLFAVVSSAFSQADDNQKFSDWLSDESALPNLEQLFIDCEDTFYMSTREPWHFLPDAESHHLDSEVADYLDSNPTLRSIHYAFSHQHGDEDNVSPNFESMEAKDNIVLTARSMKHGGEIELYHVRILLQDDPSMESKHSPSEPSERTLVMRHAQYPVKPTWQDFTCFDGNGIVPFSIIEEMKAADGGGSEEKWDRRGVEVSEAAWDILRKWQAMMTEEREVSPNFLRNLWNTDHVESGRWLFRC